VTPGSEILEGRDVRWGLLHADALLTLARLPDNSVDATLTDPPYGINFGGQAWDGADIRRTVGDGMHANEAFERWTRVWASEVARVLKPGGYMVSFGAPRTFARLVCGIEDAGLEIRDVLLWLYGTGVPKSRRMADGMGTALKPAYEPIALARAPLAGSLQATRAAWGTGTLNVDATRVGAPGYWPAHVVTSHAEGCTRYQCTGDCPVAVVDAQAGKPASRLFFCAKASRAEREVGCEQLPARSVPVYNGRPPRVVRNTHPTVKPIALLRWLVRLIAPAGGIVLDPFAGSGSTGAAALLEGRRFLGIEREAEYIKVARARLDHWAQVAETRS
jgi:DNA modification methylase